jgi:hypothetical protein
MPRNSSESAKGPDACPSLAIGARSTLLGRPSEFLLTLCVAVVLGGFARGRLLAEQESAEPAANVVEAFEKLPITGAALKFTLGQMQVPPGGHLQGIQIHFDAAANRHLVYLSHDSATVAYLVVVEFPLSLSGNGRVLHVQELPSDGLSPPLRHAGGIQLLGDVLAVGVEDNQQKTRSEVQFWNVGEPGKPSLLRHLTIRRQGAPKEQTAGAVGLVARAADHLLVVANWDSRALDFYVSNGKPLADTACRFNLALSWQDRLADKSGWKPDGLFGAYQAINLLSDSQGRLFLIGFQTKAAGADIADLFSVEMADMSAPAARTLCKLAARSMKLSAGNHFRYAGGLWIERRGLAILSSPLDFGRETVLNIAR